MGRVLPNYDGLYGNADGSCDRSPSHYKNSRELAQVIELIVVEVRSQLPDAFQEKVVAQVMLKGSRGQSLTVGVMRQKASASLI